MMFGRKQERVFSRLFNQGEAETLYSLIDDPRITYDGDDKVEYGWLSVDGETDDEIERWLDENMVIGIPSHMFWDCTGYPFTVSINWKRNPNGMVSFIHRIGYDV